MSGKVVHFEIPVDDGDRARKFYGETLGWQLMPVPEMSYTMVMTGPSDPEHGPTEPGFINGGLFERSAEFAGKAPNIVIDVPSVDEALRKVEGAGGKTVTERMPVGDMGFAGLRRYRGQPDRTLGERLSHRRPPDRKRIPRVTTREVGAHPHFHVLDVLLSTRGRGLPAPTSPSSADPTIGIPQPDSNDVPAS